MRGLGRAPRTRARPPPPRLVWSPGTPPRPPHIRWGSPRLQEKRTIIIYNTIQR